LTGSVTVAVYLLSASSHTAVVRCAVLAAGAAAACTCSRVACLSLDIAGNLNPHAQYTVFA